MIVIYDLDKTSIFCPLANKLDRFIPKNKTLKRLYYKLYTLAYFIEDLFNLTQINENMYSRAKMYNNLETQWQDDEELNNFGIGQKVQQVVVTARHYTKYVEKHVHKVFKDVDVPAVCMAQGITGLHKYDAIPILNELVGMYDSEDVIMYDDNENELDLMRKYLQDKVTTVRVHFENGHETIC